MISPQRLLVAALAHLALVVPLVSNGAAHAALPSEDIWKADVVAAMDGSGAYVVERVQQGGQQLAINLDIDNTSLASHYDPGAPVDRVLKLARRAHGMGVSLLFNTARLRGDGRMLETKRQLRRAGYPVAGICGRQRGEGLSESKQRCRAHFVDLGYTLIANIGNRDTDFVGGDYERAFRLPNYGNQLT